MDRNLACNSTKVICQDKEKLTYRTKADIKARPIFIISKHSLNTESTLPISVETNDTQFKQEANKGIPFSHTAPNLKIKLYLYMLFYNQKNLRDFHDEDVKQMITKYNLCVTHRYIHMYSQIKQPNRIQWRDYINTT